MAPRRSAADWDNEILRLETALDNAQRGSMEFERRAFEAESVLADVVEEGGNLARLVELERALWEMVNFATKDPTRYTSMNPYGRPQVRQALILLTGNPYGNPREG